MLWCSVVAVAATERYILVPPPAFLPQSDLNKFLRYMRKLPEKETIFLKVGFSTGHRDTQARANSLSTR